MSRITVDQLDITGGAPNVDKLARLRERLDSLKLQPVDDGASEKMRARLDEAQRVATGAVERADALERELKMQTENENARFEAVGRSIQALTGDVGTLSELMSDLAQQVASRSQPVSAPDEATVERITAIEEQMSRLRSDNPAAEELSALAQRVTRLRDQTAENLAALQSVVTETADKSTAAGGVSDRVAQLEDQLAQAKAAISTLSEGAGMGAINPEALLGPDPEPRRLRHSSRFEEALIDVVRPLFAAPVALYVADNGDDGDPNAELWTDYPESAWSDVACAVRDHSEFRDARIVPKDFGWRPVPPEDREHHLEGVEYERTPDWDRTAWTAALVAACAERQRGPLAGGGAAELGDLGVDEPQPAFTDGE